MDKPIEPIPPAPEQCCRSGCQPCIWDFYDQELADYREAMKQWEAEQAKSALP
ncbi:oxidoreductase-like domain-containing protein [Burkholderiaceae bacterium DAT-1]|nr:oxidoreductase-like domain-containing protein [Burkholderiaceae bacterium DAT-1]